MILVALSNALSGSNIPGYKTFFVLKSIEHELSLEHNVYPAHNCYNDDNNEVL